MNMQQKKAKDAANAARKAAGGNPNSTAAIAARATTSTWNPRIQAAVARLPSTSAGVVSAPIPAAGALLATNTPTMAQAIALQQAGDAFGAWNMMRAIAGLPAGTKTQFQQDQMAHGDEFGAWNTGREITGLPVGTEAQFNAYKAKQTAQPTTATSTAATSTSNPSAESALAAFTSAGGNINAQGGAEWPDYSNQANNTHMTELFNAYKAANGGVATPTGAATPTSANSGTGGATFTGTHIQPTSDWVLQPADTYLGTPDVWVNSITGESRNTDPALVEQTKQLPMNERVAQYPDIWAEGSPGIYYNSQDKQWYDQSGAVLNADQAKADNDAYWAPIVKTDQGAHDYQDKLLAGVALTPFAAIAAGTLAAGAAAGEVTAGAEILTGGATDTAIGSAAAVETGLESMLKAAQAAIKTIVSPAANASITDKLIASAIKSTVSQLLFTGRATPEGILTGMVSSFAQDALSTAIQKQLVDVITNNSVRQLAGFAGANAIVQVATTGDYSVTSAIKSAVTGYVSGMIWDVVKGEWRKPTADDRLTGGTGDVTLPGGGNDAVGSGSDTTGTTNVVSIGTTISNPDGTTSTWDGTGWAQNVEEGDFVAAPWNYASLVGVPDSAGAGYTYDANGNVTPNTPINSLTGTVIDTETGGVLDPHVNEAGYHLDPATGVWVVDTPVNSFTGTTIDTETGGVVDPNANKPGYHMNPATGVWEADSTTVIDTETGGVVDPNANKPGYHMNQGTGIWEIDTATTGGGTTTGGDTTETTNVMTVGTTRTNADGTTSTWNGVDWVQEDGTIDTSVTTGGVTTTGGGTTTGTGTVGGDVTGDTGSDWSTGDATTGGVEGVGEASGSFWDELRQLTGLTTAQLLALGGAGIAALSNAAGLGQKPAGTTTTVQDLPEWLKTYVSGNLSRANTYINEHPFDATGLNAATAKWGGIVGGDYLDPSTNPYLTSTFRKAAGEVGAGVDSRFTLAGRYGSGAHQGVLGTTFNKLATDIYGGNYEKERARQTAAISASPEFYKSAYEAPLTPYAQFANIAGVGTSGARTTQSPYFTNTVGNILSGALAGYGFGRGF